MSLPELIGMMGQKDRKVSSRTSKQNGSQDSGPKEAASLGTVKGWASSLLGNRERVKELKRRRGLSKETIKKYDVGWSTDQEAYTIPVYDQSGETVVNVRFYRFDVPDDRRKIWSVDGHGSPRIYPAPDIQEWDDIIIICEGEWDAMLTIQHGFHAVTRTGSAGTWRSTWNSIFQDKVVFVCHDMDDAGQKANSKVIAQLKGVAKEVHSLILPYEITEKSGKDLTDYWLEGNEREDLLNLMAAAMGDHDLSPEVAEDVANAEPVDVTVLDTFSSDNTGKPVRMRVTVTGKKYPTWIIPSQVHFSCTMDAPKCAVCPMNGETGGWMGDHTMEVYGSDAIVLEMIETPKDKQVALLRTSQGIQKCNVLTTTIKHMMSVEEIFIRPSVEDSRFSMDAGDYTTRRVLSVGRHDTLPNNTVEMVGCVRPNPENQRNELQAWKVDKTETSIDKFEMSEAMLKRMARKFRPKKGERPLAKMLSIAGDLSSHVTRIYGRDIMHVVMDLGFHSILALPYNNALLERGWLDILVIGDTRTGKSEAANKLLRHYQAGEFVSCEAASFAGIVGGIQQYGGRDWTVTWGVVPLNDRRLVVLDEVSGLTTEQIAQMSSIRSSGEAQLTKIRSERTLARTRLIWLGNPRGGGKLADQAFGVRAVLPLIGNNEDVARFDLVMSVDERDVGSAIISQDFEEKDEQVYDSEVCSALVLWAWSRRPEHIEWEEGAERLCHTLGMQLGEKYMSEPPLIQAANVRVKIARIAAAVAARTFSSPDGERLVIKKVHVEDAVALIQQVYDAPEFGYGAQSRAISADVDIAEGVRNELTNAINSTEGLFEFLRDVQEFSARDFEDVLQYGKDAAQALFNKMWVSRMVEVVNGKGMIKTYKQTSVMQDIIREIGATR